MTNDNNIIPDTTNNEQDTTIISVSTESNSLRTEGLHKRFRKRLVVNDVSIEVKQGEVVGLLGPNGAGKTTTFYMIVGMIRPSAGESVYRRERYIA